MQIGMRQLFDLIAGGADPARVTLVTMRTVQILGIGNGQRQSPYALIARKELGMADTTRFGHCGSDVP